tara:strand:+ start:1020 stop:1658 length:639 start_codon:yes stop_codon:yes gene_type:complete
VVLNKPFPSHRSYIGSKEWKARARDLRTRRGNQCEICGSSRFCQVHHNTYISKGDEDELDLIVLCADCHSIFHRRNGSRLVGVSGKTHTEKCMTCSNHHLLNESIEISDHTRKIMLCNSCIELYKDKITRKFHKLIAATKPMKTVSKSKNNNQKSVSKCKTTLNKKKSKKRKYIPERKQIKKRQSYPQRIVYEHTPQSYSVEVVRVSRPKKT